MDNISDFGRSFIYIDSSRYPNSECQSIFLEAACVKGASLSFDIYVRDSCRLDKLFSLQE